MRSSSEPRRARTALGAVLGLSVSLLIHLLVFSTLRWAGTMPSLDFELTLPSEVEFGVTEPEPAPEPAPQTPAAPPEPPPSATPSVAAPAPKSRKRAPSAPDAGTHDPTRDSEVAERGTDRERTSGRGDEPLLAAFAPEGAQIALRLNLGLLRESALAPDVRGLLDAIADFRLLLDGSELDPLADLERLYLASPDLRRSHLVIAGEYVGDETVAERAVANLASARGLPAPWTQRGAMRVAPWHDRDPTDRVLALIAPHQFAITRTDDLDRVLQVARALARRRAKARTRAAREDLGAALLALEPDQTLALSVEGVRLFVRGNPRGIPDRLEASVRTTARGSLSVTAVGYYAEPEAAERAQAYWEAYRARFADHPLVAFIGMRSPLAGAVIRAEEATVRARTEVSIQQARVVLGFVRNALAPPPPAPGIEPRQPGAAPSATGPEPAPPSPEPGRSERVPLEPDRASSAPTAEPP